MTGSWNGHAEKDEDDYLLQNQLRSIDKRFAEMFAPDIDDPDQVAALFSMIDRHIERENEQEMCFREALSPQSRTSHDLPAPIPRAIHLSSPLGTIAIALGVVGFFIAIIMVVKISVGLPLSSSSEAKLASVGGLEKPDLKISVMKTTDLGPFWLAVRKGYFKDAGFTFDPDKDVTLAQSGSESVDRLVARKVDIAYSTYPSFFVAKNENRADIKLVADASSAGPNSCMVVAGPNSKVRSMKDISRARVGVTSRNTISDLMVMSTLKASGVDYTSIEWVQVPFSSMSRKLASGEIDAAFLTEPFLTQAEVAVGAIPLFDAATGPTANLPTAGFGANADFVREFPRTLTAFQKIMERATAEAKADRSQVEELLQQFLGIDSNTAKLVTLLTFQSSLEANRIQRVADLMTEFGIINERMDISQMIAKAPDTR